jgi:sec-independent protein translocase protein TatB
MFDLGWTELLLIGIVALIVVGPKDLPVLFRKVGEFVGKARGMAREFSKAMNDAAQDSGVSDVSKTLKAATNPLETSLNSVKSAAKSFGDFDLDTETGKLAAERAEASRKIHEATAKRAEEKRIAEAAAQDAKEASPDAAAADPEPQPMPDPKGSKETS